MSAATQTLARFALDPTLSGLELARRWMRQGLVAGLNGTLNVRPVHVEAGKVGFACAVTPAHGNFVELVHGGVSAALVDIAGGAAAMTLLAPGETLLTSDLSIRFLAPTPLKTDQMVAQGQVTYQAGRKIIAEVSISAGETVVALGSVSISIRPPQPR